MPFSTIARILSGVFGGAAEQGVRLSEASAKGDQDISNLVLGERIKAMFREPRAITKIDLAEQAAGGDQKAASILESLAGEKTTSQLQNFAATKGLNTKELKTRLRSDPGIRKEFQDFVVKANPLTALLEGLVQGGTGDPSSFVIPSDTADPPISPEGSFAVFEDIKSGERVGPIPLSDRAAIQEARRDKTLRRVK